MLVWAVAVVLALAALHLAGGSALAPPPLTSPSRWASWAQQRDPVVAAFAVVRVLALVFGWYALAVTVAGSAARLASRRRLVAALDRLTLPPLRRLLAASVSVSLGAGVMTPALAATDRHRASVVAEAEAPTTTTNTTPTVTMRRLPPAAAPAPGVEGTWTVQPGQSFWSIAEAVLAERSGRRPPPREVVPYWHRLIDANRAELVDPDNPDLILPGQVFAVPPP